MAQYAVVVVALVSAESEEAAKQEADCLICQDGGGTWVCKVLSVDEELDQ